MVGVAAGVESVAYSQRFDWRHALGRPDERASREAAAAGIGFLCGCDEFSQVADAVRELLPANWFVNC